MTAPDGAPHGAVRGLLQTIERLRERFAPATLIAAWDTDWRPQWRVDLLSSYKTHRLAAAIPGVEDAPGLAAIEEEPDDLSPQIDAIYRILTAWGVPVIGVEGFEADDVLGTLAPMASRSGLSSLVVTGDRDLVQLVDKPTKVLLTVKGGMEAWPILDEDATRERFGVLPSQYVDVATLRGDPSDGLPGVKGIGDKTATALVKQFGSLAEVVKACSSDTLDKPLTPRIASAILNASEYLAAAQIVSTVRSDVPIPNAPTVLESAIPVTPADPDSWGTAVDEWGVRRFAEAAMSGK